MLNLDPHKHWLKHPVTGIKPTPMLGLTRIDPPCHGKESLSWHGFLNRIKHLQICAGLAGLFTIFLFYFFIAQEKIIE